MNEQTEGEYFAYNDRVILLIGEDVWSINPKASPRQIGLQVRKLVEEHLKKAGGASESTQ